MSGKHPRELIGRKCYREFEKQNDICPYCPVAKVIDTGLPEAIETEEIRDDGSHFNVRIQVFPIKKQNGSLAAFIEIVEDITNRKTAEKALASERERLAVTIGSIGDAVIATDVNGNVTLMNRVAEKLTGYTLDEARGKHLDEVFHIINENTRERCENPVVKVLSTGKIIGLANHTVLISRDGYERVIADSGSPIKDKEDNIIGVVLVFRDITYQRKMEQEFQKTQKIKSVGILAGGIAHDFNNLLVGIMGNISLTKLQIKEESEGFKLLEEAELAATRAKNLTQQLLTFSKGGMPIKKASSIGELVKESASFALSGSNLQCDFDIRGDLWKADVDTGQINQVIHNLMINAKEAMPEGGSVSVSIKNVELGSKEIPPLKKGRYLKTIIKDHGVGIHEKFLPNIFDPYFTTKQAGSGLGLATSYSIIKKHDGHIKVESKIGEGTSFTIFLPAARKNLKYKENSRAQLKRGKGRILVMDDNKIVLDVAKRMLEMLGYSADCVPDGESAIKAYQDALDTGNVYTAVILDLTIPGKMGGRDTLKELLKIDPDVRAIVSSGYSTDPVMAEHKKHGFMAVMVKPYTIENLSNVLQSTTS
jgi:PAS domain S-box-containing protein